MIKNYWKIAAAAVLLTAAGFCYVFFRGDAGGVLNPAAGDGRDPELLVLAGETKDTGSFLGSGGAGGTGGEAGTDRTAGSVGTGGTDGAVGISGTAGTDMAGGTDKTAGVIGTAGSDSVGQNSSDNGSGVPGGPGEESGESGQEGAAGAAAESAAQPVCFVHICGEVKNPGVYELKEGSRIFQAVEAAGGLTEEADADRVNLAAPVLDGMKVQIPGRDEVLGGTGPEQAWGSAQYIETVPEPVGKTKPKSADAVGTDAGGGQKSAGPAAGSGTKTVNINTAGIEELTGLDGIGKARAEDIIRYRTEHGGFQKIEEIMSIPGIKDALFQKIKDSITV